MNYRDIFPDFRSSVEECRVLPLMNGIRQASPLLPGERCITEGYEGRFLSGFEEGYRKVCENREGIARTLDRHAAAPLRYLFRPNIVYLSVQKAYWDAESQEEKVEALNKLGKDLSEKGRTRWEKILAWERASIIAGNLPVFTVPAGSEDLRGEQVDDVLIPGFFECSPIEEAKRRINRMGDEDLAIQAAYIRASLKHVDGWTFELEKEQSFDGNTVLSSEAALEEVCETIDLLWEERIPLAQGRMLWHIPLVSSEAGSLLGFAEAFTGTAVFAHACAESPMIVGEAKAKAEEMAAAAFRSVATFGTYFLNKYPDPPAERLLSRRLKGGLVLKDVLAGLLWTIGQCATEDPETADRLLRGFKNWKLDGADERAIASLKHRYENAQANTLMDTDILDGGNAGLVAALLLEAQADTESTEPLEKAGRILSRMVERKRGSGCFRVFRSGRKQFFLPGLYRGSTGIAAVMLRYAELLRGDVRNRTGTR